MPGSSRPVCLRWNRRSRLTAEQPVIYESVIGGVPSESFPPDWCGRCERPHEDHTRPAEVDQNGFCWILKQRPHWSESEEPPPW